MTAKRIAVNNGGSYVPGLNSILLGVARAAGHLGWEVVGIRDGFDGLLFPDRYPEGGIINLTPGKLDGLSASDTPLLGTAARTDPFFVRTVSAENQVEELDRSDELLEKIRDLNLAAVISVVDMGPLSILFKLSRKGLRTICLPASVENDVATTQLSFGFNSVLSCTVDLLGRARQAAQSSRKIGVVEVLGQHSGWLALQAGIAADADAILIPEIPYDLQRVASALRSRGLDRSSFGLVVVAEGAEPLSAGPPGTDFADPHPLKSALAPLATGPEGAHVIDRSGSAAKTVAAQLQRNTGKEAYPLVLGQLIKSGAPTAVDRQLGLAYGSAAVRAVSEDRTAVLVAFDPPDLKFVPLTEAINKIRTIPPNSLFLQTARSLGICLGE